jgi:hypothetical protein
MNSVWREYGVIGTLLVVAVGGYLLMSRQQKDVLGASLQSIGGHLLALVPDAGGRDDVQAALDTLQDRVRRGSVPPEQIERFAASVFNLGTSGDSLAAAEAEMVVRLAYSDPAALPAPRGGVPPQPAARPHLTGVAEMDRLADELAPMVAFYETINVTADSMGPAFRFYSDGKLHVVVDDRLREKIEGGEAAKVLMRDKSMSWRARFSEAAEADRQRHLEHAERLTRVAENWSDTLAIGPAAEVLARMSRLRSMGFVTEADVDSIMARIESEVNAILRELPPPPPPAPRHETSSASVSSSSVSSTG